MMPRILLVTDRYFGEASGAWAARAAARAWQDVGAQVDVFAEAHDARPQDQMPGVRIYARRPYSGIHHLRGGAPLAEFREVLDDARPTHVFLFGNSNTKPVSFFRECRRRRIPRIAWYWCQEFFCNGHYGCLPQGPCTRCISNLGFSSVLYGCGYNAHQRPSARNLLTGMVVRRLLKPEQLACEVLMGGSLSQLDLYRRFGVPEGRLIQCPLFYPRERTPAEPPSKGDYFVCSAYPRKDKGYHLIGPVMSHCSKSKLVISIAKAADAHDTVSRFGLAGLVGKGTVEIVSGQTWTSGLARLVARARGALIPSVWPTTTEYTLLEALSLAKPVVAFNLGVHADAIRHGTNGLLSPVADVGGMAANLDAVTDDDELYDRLSAGASRLFDSLTLSTSFRGPLARALDVADQQVRLRVAG